MKLIVEPNDGVAPILAAIKSARKSIDIAIFRFDRRDVESALVDAAKNGVRVTALIAFVNRGGEAGLRKLEMRFLAEGITVARTSGDLSRYHDKFIVIDRRVLCVLSTNFTHLDIDRSRGFGIVTSHAGWVHEARRLFRADCSRVKYVSTSETFVVSPGNARKSLAAFLRRAKKDLLIYDPQISDKEMLGILQAREAAGVSIRIIGTVTRSLKFNTRKLGGMRLHTRTIIRDGRQAFIGSQSLRGPELDSRRELGLIIRDAKAVRKLIETFESDWKSKRTTKAKEEKKHAGKEKSVAPNKKSEKAVKALEKDMTPIVRTMKKAVKRAVAKAGEDVLRDKGVKDEMKAVAKEAVKDALKEAVQENRKT